MKGNRQTIVISLLLSAVCCSIVAGCRKPPSSFINQALSATNGTFRPAGGDLMPLTEGQIAGIKQIVRLFPEHSAVKRTDEDLVADMGKFWLGDRCFGWRGDTLELFAEHEYYCFVVTNAALRKLTEEYLQRFGKGSLDSNDWAGMLTVLDQTNSRSTQRP